MSAFVDNGDGTVTDATDRARMWEKKVAGSGCLHCVDDVYTVSQSGAWISEVKQSGLGGFTDWRIPTLEELLTILDRGRCHDDEPDPCISPIFGPTAADFYLSTTIPFYITFGNDGRWLVSFRNGSPEDVAFSAIGNVRAVRTIGPPP